MMGGGPTEPTEQFFRRGLWGWASTTWERLTSLSNLLGVALHGYDGSDWQKLPLVWGYTDRWAVTRSDLSATAGSNTLQTIAVPAGEIYILHALTGLNVNSICSMRFRVRSASIACTLTTFINQAASVVAAKDYTGLVLKEGDQAEVVFDGCTLNDDIYLVAWGAKMAVG